MARSSSDDLERGQEAYASRGWRHRTSAFTAPTKRRHSMPRTSSRSQSRPSDSYRQWVRDGWARLRSFSTGRTYINFQTADEDDARIRATYGENYDRLVAVKRKYDPDNLFRVNRNIPLG